MNLSSTLWSRILGLFGRCAATKEQAREGPQDGSYQHSKMQFGPSVKNISAKCLDGLAKTPSVSGSGPYASKPTIGDLRILEEIILEDSENTKTYYLLQREIRDKEKIPNTSHTVQQLWFEHYMISWGDMARTPIGKKLLVEWGLQHPAFEVFCKTFPEDDAFDRF